MVGRKGNRRIKHFKILKAKKQMLKSIDTEYLGKLNPLCGERRETTLFTQNPFSLRSYKYRYLWR